MPPLRPPPYTEPAHQLLGLASEIAAGLGVAGAGTEHLLLALLSFPKAGAAMVLARAGIAAEDIHRRLRSLMVAPGAGTPRRNGPPTGAVNQVLADAGQEAAELGLGCVASEQILVALLRQPDTVAAQVLGELGLDLGRTRTLVRELHALPGPPVLVSESPASTLPGSG